MSFSWKQNSLLPFPNKNDPKKQNQSKYIALKNCHLLSAYCLSHLTYDKLHFLPRNTDTYLKFSNF